MMQEAWWLFTSQFLMAQEVHVLNLFRIHIKVTNLISFMTLSELAAGI